MEAGSLLDLNETDHADLFNEDAAVWSSLSLIGSYLETRLDELEGKLLRGNVDARAVVGPRVYIAEGASVEANAVIKGPAWIGSGTVVRSGAYVREGVIAGDGCVLGNSSEFKNCVLFNSCEVPHFNYVGDSILGYRAHLGAGVICSNVRLDRRNVHLTDRGGARIDTGLRKFGAIVGDRTEVGCNSVLSPGSILGRDCIVYPCTQWNGILEEKQIVKNQPPLKIVPRRSA